MANIGKACYGRRDGGLQTVDEHLSSALFDKLFFAPVINPNDTISHSSRANLAGKMSLSFDERRSADRFRVAYQSTPSTS